MLEISRRLFDELNCNQIKYCHFKSNEHLEAGLDGDTDLDVLFDVSQKEKVEKIYRNLNFKQFEPTKIGTYPGVHNWYGFDETTGKLIHVHTHYNLISGKGLIKDYYIPWDQYFLEDACFDEHNSVKIVNPSLEYILLCSRIIIKRKIREKVKNHQNTKVYLEEDFVRELDFLRERLEEDQVKEYIHKLFSKESADYLYNTFLNIKELSKDEFKKLDKVIRKEFRKNRRYNRVIANIISYRNKIERKVIIKLNKKFNVLLPQKKRACQKGLSIAFVGIDGSGKSTVSTAITKWLSSEFDTIKYYAGAGDGRKNKISAFLLNVYKKNSSINGKLNANKLESENKNKKTPLKVKIKNVFGSITYYRILKDNIKHIMASDKLVKKGCFCLMDRYPQGSVESEHDGPKIRKYLKDKNFMIVKYLAKKEKKIFEELNHNEYPQYDVLFKMMISPELAIQRKQEEHDYEDLLKKSKSYDKIDFKCKEVIEIDASEKLDEVILKVKSKIWQSL